jgi:hypothetical protein
MLEREFSQQKGREEERNMGRDLPITEIVP